MNARHRGHAFNMRRRAARPKRAQSTHLHLVRLDVTPHRLGERRDGISDRLRAELAATSRLKVDQARLNLFLADDGEDRHLCTIHITRVLDYF